MLTVSFLDSATFSSICQTLIRRRAQMRVPTAGALDRTILEIGLEIFEKSAKNLIRVKIGNSTTTLCTMKLGSSRKKSVLAQKSLSDLSAIPKYRGRVISFSRYAKSMSISSNVIISLARRESSKITHSLLNDGRWIRSTSSFDFCRL